MVGATRSVLQGTADDGRRQGQGIRVQRQRGHHDASGQEGPTALRCSMRRSPMKEKTVIIEIDEQGNSWMDLEGSQGSGCSAVAKDFQGSDAVKNAQKKREYISKFPLRRSSKASKRYPPAA